MHFIFIRCLKVYASEGSKLWVNHYFSLLNGVFSICCILRPDLSAPLSVIPQLKGGEGLRKTIKCKTWKSTRSCTKIRKAKEGDGRALNCKKNEWWPILCDVTLGYSFLTFFSDALITIMLIRSDLIWWFRNGLFGILRFPLLEIVAFFEVLCTLQRRPIRQQGGRRL